MSKVNFEFIAKLEGGRRCIGYVPDADNSKSGVTIATGFDLGQRSINDLFQLLPSRIAKKLSAYCYVKGQAAQQLLSEKPLEINQLEAQLIDVAVKGRLIRKLEQSYNQLSLVAFDQLPEPAQTVIMSVAFQYGDLAKRCPKFWQFAINQDWLGMVNELRNFGDRYPSRRNVR